MHFVIAQLNPTVADIHGNTQLVIKTLHKVKEKTPHALVIFPEMMISGYCPQDFLLRPDFVDACKKAVQKIAKYTDNLTVILGSPYPSLQENTIANQTNIINAAIIYQEGKVSNIYGKKQLPNYGVFDEKRYFVNTDEGIILQHQENTIGVIICEDGWQKEGLCHIREEKLDCIISLNASPFEQHKNQQRQLIAQQIYDMTQTPIIYTNMIGGQDELIFDGGSFIFSATDHILALPQFKTGAFVINYDVPKKAFTWTNTLTINHPQATNCIQRAKTDKKNDHTPMQTLYHALQLGLGDYVIKNGFPKVILGLSGGIDSALTCALAVDTLGADKVITVMLASPHTSQLSIDLAQQQAELLGTEHYHLNLLDSIRSVEHTLLSIWSTLPQQQAISRQNIQARLRGLLLMALSNEHHALLLSTGNKSELAVGYATLYGDMAGGFSPIKDVYKTEVYALSHYRNSLSLAIPEQVIKRPPTAELAPNQKDSDNLPEYHILDAILDQFISQRRSAGQISEQGFEAETVKRVIDLVLKNQHKRQQGSLGNKVSHTAFGRDFRYPNTQRWQ